MVKLEIEREHQILSRVSLMREKSCGEAEWETYSTGQVSSQGAESPQPLLCSGIPQLFWW